jgi:exosortase family protein XrtF
VKEFKPTILFLVKFLGIYVVANVVYGLYVTAYEPRPDPVTRWVTIHTTVALTGCGWPTDVQDTETKPTTKVMYQGRSVLSVYEGCNGINVMIIFVAFVVSFGGARRAMVWFIPLGILVLHGINLARIALLFWVSLYMPDFMYFTHKYFFTAILYVVVFVLWIVWVKRYASDKPAVSE